MKKSYFLSVILTMGIMLFASDATAQDGVVRNDSRISAVFIMEDVLFKGLTAESEADLLAKKILRVEQEISDPSARMGEASAEASRKTALVQLKTRLVAQRNKLKTNSTN